MAWKTHSLWLIGILVAIICWLLLKTPSGNAIRDYLGFAASIAALILAIIAIFQAIIAQNRNATADASLQDSIRNIREAAANISTTSESLLSQQEAVIGHVETIPRQFDSLTDQLNEIASKRQTGAQASNDDPLSIRSVLNGAAAGLHLTLAILALAAKSGKSFDIAKVYSADEDFSIMAWATGALQAICSLRPWGLNIAAIADEGVMFFRVVDQGNFDPEEALSVFHSYPRDAEEERLWQIAEAHFANVEPGQPEVNERSRKV